MNFRYDHVCVWFGLVRCDANLVVKNNILQLIHDNYDTRNWAPGSNFSYCMYHAAFEKQFTKKNCLLHQVQIMVYCCIRSFILCNELYILFMCVSHFVVGHLAWSKFNVINSILYKLMWHSDIMEAETKVNGKTNYLPAQSIHHKTCTPCLISHRMTLFGCKTKIRN